MGNKHDIEKRLKEIFSWEPPERQIPLCIIFSNIYPYLPKKYQDKILNEDRTVLDDLGYSEEKWLNSLKFEDSQAWRDLQDRYPSVFGERINKKQI